MLKDFMVDSSIINNICEAIGKNDINFLQKEMLLNEIKKRHSQFNEQTTIYSTDKLKNTIKLCDFNTKKEQLIDIKNNSGLINYLKRIYYAVLNNSINIFSEDEGYEFIRQPIINYFEYEVILQQINIFNFPNSIVTCYVGYDAYNDTLYIKNN